MATSLEDKLAKENSELRCYIERLRDALATEAEQFKAIRCYTQDGKLAAICADHEDRINKVVQETPAQSIRHIESRVEEETIERCIGEVYRSADVYDAGEALEDMPRKYKEQSDED